MSSLDQSSLQNLIRSTYGGSDLTSPDFTRPYYNKYNALSKSRDFGLVDNLLVSLTGTIGSQTGSSTLFFKVTTRGPSRFAIVKRPINKYTDRYLNVGLVDRNRDPVQLNGDGVAYENAVHNGDPGSPVERLPEGTYYFTVSCDQWQSTPFEVVALVQRFVLLSGVSLNTIIPRLRFSLLKSLGIVELTAAPTGTLLAPTLRVMNGFASGSLLPQVTLVIPSGVASGSLEPYGRLKETLRIEGAATGSSPSIATINVTRRPGYGY